MPKSKDLKKIQLAWACLSQIGINLQTASCFLWLFQILCPVELFVERISFCYGSGFAFGHFLRYEAFWNIQRDRNKRKSKVPLEWRSLAERHFWFVQLKTWKSIKLHGKHTFSLTCLGKTHFVVPWCDKFVVMWSVIAWKSVFWAIVATISSMI